MKVMIGPAEFEFFFLLDDRRRRRDHDLLDFVDAAAFFAALHFENEAVFLANLGRDVGLDRQVRVRENVEVIHQLFDELEIFHAELQRQILHDDRRLDVNDLAAVLGLFDGFGRFAGRGRRDGRFGSPARPARAQAGVARMREIGGRNERFTASSEDRRFGFGVCGSINETLSTAGFGTGGSGAAQRFRALAGFFAVIGAKADFVARTAPPVWASAPPVAASWFRRARQVLSAWPQRGASSCFWLSSWTFSRACPRRGNESTTWRTRSLSRFACRRALGAWFWSSSFSLAFKFLKICSWP